MKYLSFIPKPPSFEDEDKAQAAALLHFILLSTIAIVTLEVVAYLFLDRENFLLKVNLVALPIMITLFIIMRMGKVRLAAILMVVFLWLVVAYIAYSNGGILDPVYGAQTLTIVVAGLLISGSASLVVAGLSSAFGWWMVGAAEAGQYVSKFGQVDVQQAWVDNTAYFMLIALFMVLSLRVIRDARRRAVEQARSQRQSDERYRALVQSAPDTIFTIDRNHQIVYMNRSTFGTIESRIGHSVYEFLLPASHDAYRTALNRVLETGSVEQIEIQNFNPSQEPFWYSVRFAPVWEENKVVEVTAIGTNITVHKRAEEALRASEEQYRELFEANPHPMFVTEIATQKFLAVNDAAVSKYGFSRDELLTMNADQLRIPEDNALAADVIKGYEQEKLNYLPLGVWRHVKKDKSLLYVELVINRLNYKGHSAVMVASYDITERLRAEQALRQSETHLSGILESAMDAIITIDDHQNIIYFNAAAENMFQCKSKEAQGQPITNLVPEPFTDTRGEQIPVSASIRLTNRHLGTSRGRRANGEVFPVEASISQLELESGQFYTIILRDITERKRAEESVKRSEALFSTIFRSVPVAISIISLENQRILNVNDYITEFTGFASSELIGKVIEEAPFWTHPDQWQRLLNPVDEEGVFAGNEFDWRTNTGQVVTMLGSTVQTEINGTPCILAIALDITDRKQAEQDHLEAEKLRLQVYKERDVLELKEKFISSMSHEFRTPLTVILTTKESLQVYFDRLTPERRMEKLKNIEEQVLYVTGMLDEVLTISKVRAGKMKFDPTRINLATYCEKLFEQMQMLDTANHEFTFVNDHRIGETTSDVNLLQHVLVNLLSNAIKYSPEGGEVRFELHRNGDQATIRISDQGIGIPEEDQKHLFEPFYRATNTGTIKGTGLGLSIVKESVEAHGGTINVISAPGEGTTFVVRLPLTSQN